MDTDSMIENKHGWGKDFDANCANFREGVRGWMGCLPYGHRARQAKQERGWRIEDGGWPMGFIRLNPTESNQLGGVNRT